MFSDFKAREFSLMRVHIRFMDRTYSCPLYCSVSLGFINENTTKFPLKKRPKMQLDLFFPRLNKV
jgi:hypothetical protein